MAAGTGELRRSLPAIGAGVPAIILIFAVLGIVLTAAGPTGLGLSPSQTSTWIVAIYCLPAIPAVVLSLRYRQPLLLTGNVFAIIFFGTLGHQFSFRELAGAAFVAGAIVLLIALFGLTSRLAAWVPAPVVHGLVAGAVLPFVADVFSGLNSGDGRGWRVPFMVGSALVAYLLSRRFLSARVPPIFGALAAGLVAAGATGQFGQVPSSFEVPDVVLAWPEFSLAAIASVTPVLVAIVFLQSNLPCIVYMRAQGFDPPERTLNVVSGIGTMAASAVGPCTIALAVPLVPLTAGPTVGDLDLRYRSVFLPAATFLAIAALAATAAELANLVPPVLLRSLAGLALAAVLISSLQEIVRGPLLLGPVFAFAIAMSDMRLFELGPFFWSLVIGVGVSQLLEREESRALSAS